MYSAVVLWKPRTSNALILSSYYIYLIIVFTYDEYLFRFQYFIEYLVMSSNFSWTTEIRNECCIKETSVSFSPPPLQPGAMKQNCSFFLSSIFVQNSKEAANLGSFFLRLPTCSKAKQYVQNGELWPPNSTSMHCSAPSAFQFFLVVTLDIN